MRILLAMDHSEQSQAALAVVASRLWPAGSRIRVIRIVEPVEPLYDNPFDRACDRPGDLCRQAQDELLKQAGLIVNEAAARLSGTFGEGNVEFSVGGGDIAEKILEEASAWQADLIVVGSHGRHGASELLLGSISRSIIIQSNCSVEVARAPTDGTASGDHNIRTPQLVLLALDSSPYSQAVADSVQASVWPGRARFVLMTAVKAPGQGQPELSALNALDRLEEQQRLHAVGQQLLSSHAHALARRFGRESVTTSIAVGDPCCCVVDAAAELNADLVIVGSHGRRGFSRLMLGSVSEAVATHARCSVRIIKPGGLT